MSTLSTRTDDLFGLEQLFHRHDMDRAEHALDGVFTSATSDSVFHERCDEQREAWMEAMDAAGPEGDDRTADDDSDDMGDIEGMLAAGVL